MAHIIVGSYGSFKDGSVTLPSMGFSAEPSLGFYRASAGKVGLSGCLLLPDGSAVAPSLAFASDPDTGFYSSGIGRLNAVVGGASKGVFTSIGLEIFGGTQITAVSPLSITQTVNAAAIAFPGIKFVMTEGASGSAAGTKVFDLWYGVSGAEASIVNFGKLGTAFFASTVTSGASVVAGAGAGFVVAGKGRIFSSADGVLDLKDAPATGFLALNLGPTTGNTGSGTDQFTHINATIDMSTASGTGTNTITIANFFPAGVMPLSFSGRVTTILAGLLLTTFSIGTTGDTNAFGGGLAIAQDTLINGTTYTVDPTTLFTTAATNLVITAAAGVFSTGVLKVTALVLKPIAIGS